MQCKTITITSQMEHWVKSQVDSGKYGNDNEYFRDIVRRDQEGKLAEIQLLDMFNEAESSEISKQTPQEIWKNVEAQHQ